MVSEIPAEDIKCRGRGMSAGTGAGDHVHCFVSAPPKLSITAIMKYLKGISGRKLFEYFPEIRNQLWKGELWNHSYYVEMVGSVSEENIRRYIEHQSKAY